MSKLVDQVLSDEGFRERARTDLESALAHGGYDLQSDETEAVGPFHTQAVGMSNHDIAGAMRRQGG